MMSGMNYYRERPTAVPGVVLWEKVVEPGSEHARILPDGCLDLLWDGRRLFVAGPDSTARWHDSLAGTRYVALRFSGGAGPAVLGVPADELRDQTPGLEDLWPSAEMRFLAERVAADPVDTLEAFAVERAASWQVDGFGPRVLAMAKAGLPVATMADRLGMSTRQLHRRCLPTFGYGPRRLARVVRMGRALDMARTCAPLAQVATGCGYADQAHLCSEIRDLAGTTPTVLLGELHLR
jgi:AraC-like DNA-binding protein